MDVAVALERARAACDEFLERPQGVVRVSAFQSGAQLLLPALLTRVAGDRGHHARVHRRGRRAGRLRGADRPDGHRRRAPARRRRRVGRRPGVRVVPLLREPLDVAVPLDHPLAQRAEVRPADLRRPAVDRGARGVPRRDGARRGRRAARAPRRGSCTGSTTSTWSRRWSRPGHGVSLLPRYTFGGGRARAAGPAGGRPRRPPDRRAAATRPRRAAGGPPGPRRAPRARGGHRYRIAPGVCARVSGVSEIWGSVRSRSPVPSPA